jgi:hypothetical protein|uniref:Uncharacterized protein n=1 Tax=viral metagenome TaxID=1070528 RepID=A0A6C0JDP6_9ZZZZ
MNTVNVDSLSEKNVAIAQLGVHKTEELGVTDSLTVGDKQKNQNQKSYITGVNYDLINNLRKHFTYKSTTNKANNRI